MTIKEMQARLRVIAEESKTASGKELARLSAEAEEIGVKIEEARQRAKIAQGASSAAAASARETTTAENGAKLKHGGKVIYNAQRLIFPQASHTTTEEVLPVHTAAGVNGTFNELSSILARVKAVYLPGGESYTRGFVKGYGTGAYTNEAAEYAAAAITFGKVTVEKTKVTAYDEESEEFLKLADSDYDANVRYGVGLAIRKKLAAEILVGDGSTGHLKGIFYNPASTDDEVIDSETDLEVSEIDNTTLDNIIYSYGGDENVEDIAVLILNKQDLAALATLRTADGYKVHTVKSNGNYGTIDNTPFIISSACGAITSDTTASGTYCMAYGVLSAYELAIFSDLEIKRDESYKFREGLIANRAAAFMGGGVTMWNGFKRVKKA